MGAVSIKFTPITAVVLLCALFLPKAQGQAAMPAQAVMTVQEENNRFVDLFVPFRTEKAALSPDGKYIAYSLREGEELSIVVVEVANPAKATAKVKVVTDEAATPMLDIQSTEKTPANLRWMRWVTPTRLVVETNRCFPFYVNNGKPDSPDSAWQNCVGEILAFDADGKNARSLTTPRDTAEAVPTAGGKNHSLPRTPRIVDLCDDDPNAVWVQAEGVPRETRLRYIERFKLNIDTGKLKSADIHAVAIERAYLFDRKGTPRVSIPVSTIDPFPHRFLLEPNSLFKRGRPLDQVVVETSPGAFEISPSNYFNHRAVPIGFGADPDVLYFASNAGRDTFGLYGLDLKTGKRTSFQAESPIFDLYVPTAGIYPDTSRGSLHQNKLAEDTQNAFEDTIGIPEADASTNLPSPNAGTAVMQQNQAASDAQMDALERTQFSGSSISQNLARQAKAASLLGNPEISPLIFDRFTHDVVGFRYEGKTHTCTWFNSNLAEVQATLEKQFPGRSVDILDWDNTYQKTLLRVRGTVDSGAFYIYDRTIPRLSEFVQRAPGLSREKLHETTDFSYLNAAGQNVSGTFTFPRAARSVPLPVVIVCQPQPWARVHIDFQSELQAYAEMGFAVIQVNTRGAWGFGVKQREEVKGGYEAIQIADLLGSVDYLAKRFAINPRRIALVGKSHGGYLALRALQLFPTRFRCAIAFDSVLDIKSWFQESRWSSADAYPILISSYFGDPTKLAASELLTKPETITKPVLLLNFRGDGEKSTPLTYLRAKSFSAALNRHDVPSEIFDLSDDYVDGLPNAKAEAFRKIEDFLNTYIYDFKVKMGELKIIKED